jgi:SOS-response transcriptional repressor LexA
MAAATLLCDISDMSEDRRNPPIYETLMALKPEDLTANAWALRAGVNRTVFNDIRRHNNPSRKTLEKLLAAIQVSPSAFEALVSPVYTEVVGAGPLGAGDVRREFRPEDRAPALPLYGSAIGGEYGPMEDHIELTELYLSEVLEYLVRPSFLAADGRAYALKILGESMAPRYEPGERVAISPREPVAIGDDVIVQLRNTGDGDDDRIRMVLIKRLVRSNRDFVELRQFNPEKIFTVPRAEIAHIHKVVARLI